MLHVLLISYEQHGLFLGQGLEGIELEKKKRRLGYNRWNELNCLQHNLKGNTNVYLLLSKIDSHCGPVVIVPC
jgi:hypothetical protein